MTTPKMTEPTTFVQNDDRWNFLAGTRTSKAMDMLNAGGFFQINLNDATVRSLGIFIPANCVAVSISCEAGAGHTAGAVVARYGFSSSNLTGVLGATFGNPMYDGTYIEITNRDNINTLQIVRSTAFNHVINIQFFEELQTN